VGVVAHIDHGKTTMTDSVLAEAGLLSWQVAGSARALDYLEEEQRRGITIKTANVSLLHETEGSRYVINMIDTPGHVDFTGKVTRAMRAVDGVIVVVDAVEEVMAQTETVTRQALEERVKPVIFINKIDRLINELKLNADQIQSKLAHIAAEFNALIEIYAERQFKEKWRADAARESIVLGSALHKWGFTVEMMKQRGLKFNDLMESCKKGEHQALSKMLPLHTAILDTVVKNCPSPVEAQEYRIPKIWRGKLNSTIGRAMINCDDDGPTTMCITSVQVHPEIGTIATGRLFSGSVKEADHVYLVEAKKEYHIKQVFMCMSAFREAVSQIPAGNVAALSGMDLARAGETVIDYGHKDNAVPFEDMRYASERVLTVTVEPDDPKDLPLLNKALDRLLVEDPNLDMKIDERTGEYQLSGMGELHLETSMKFLKDYSRGAEITSSQPTTDYRESVAGKGTIVLAKSPNKLNSFKVRAEQSKETPQLAAEENERNVWAIDEYSNKLIDATKNASVPTEARDSIISGFKWACKNGPLCGQPLRTVKVSLVDVKLQAEPKLREPTQIERGISRAILGSFLTAEPILLEPTYKIELSTPIKWFGKCTNILASRRTRILTTENRGPISLIRGYLPVAEALGLSAELRSSTSGRVFWQTTFDHWEKVPGKMAEEIIRQIRMRKGLPPEIPKPTKFVDEA
ncbi:MAG TPA: GTP-binding protein, partial [Candidatus Acidoferrum sp.]|nr:GTP-binding protein [Candidatus Acidoferrum sp.]